MQSFNICALRQQHAYSQSGSETSARGCRSTSPFLCTFSLPWSTLFPSLPFSVWKVSVKGPRWKAALNGSVIAETVLPAQGATRIAHSELLRPAKMHTATVQSLCMCNSRKMFPLTASYSKRFIPAVFRQHVRCVTWRGCNVKWHAHTQRGSAIR